MNGSNGSRKATRRGMAVAAVLACTASAAWVHAGGGHIFEETRTPEQARPPKETLSPDAARRRGPEGLAAWIADHEALIAKGRGLDALDRICAQHDCAGSRLYWYTDLDEAKAAAEASGRPILSLRMLGRLDEPLSCANSRFFRTTVYPDAEVRARLARDFVLHWESMRPVPRVTVDLGDGRTLETTVTGNSAHYLLDAAGRPLDVLAGYHGAGAFAEFLEHGAALAAEIAGVGNLERTRRLRAHHAARADALGTAFVSALTDVGRAPETLPAVPPRHWLDRLVPDTDEATWNLLTWAHRGVARIDGETEDFLRDHYPETVAALAADRIAVTKSLVERPLLESLVHDLAADTVRNRYRLQPEIHARFEAGGLGDDLAAIDAWVYRELFLAPLDDPYHGLMPRDPFTAARRVDR